MKTPSLYQNRILDKDYVNTKYWGRVPQFLHVIDEANIYECNPEYLLLLLAMMDGSLNEENISQELNIELIHMINIIADPPGSRTKRENIILECLAVSGPDDPLIFDLIYFADEADSTSVNPNGTNSRVLGMDPKSMTLANEIKLKPYSHAGSCDRAGFTDKMYVRTATTHYDPDRYLGIVDLVTGQWIGEILLNYKPRSSGAFNKFKNVHVISTKEFPWVHVISVATDSVIFSTGHDVGSPIGNDGGNATGHSVWLDKDHFAFLDRHAPSIEIWKMNGNSFPYNFHMTQIIHLKAGCHSLRAFGSNKELDATEFFAAIEGDMKRKVLPDMKKYSFDSVSGRLNEIGSVKFKDTLAVGSFGDAIHHFGPGLVKGKRIIAVPLTKSNRIYIIDADTWTLDTNRWVPSVGYYHAGNGGSVACAHADFCNNSGLDLAVLTNHKGKSISIIDFSDNSITEVAIPSLWNYTEGTLFAQSHANKVIGTNYYFFEAVNGIFYEIDLLTKKITRSCVTGGKPVQSTS